ncbi:MAG: hypothetical protein K2M74_02075, partial [Bacteroidales bacterium]|nr:hypothetical protein [Bacteroidales bacterium]
MLHEAKNYYICNQANTNETMGKEYRKDNTYILTAGTGENPKLGVRLCDDGRDSLFLDYYFGFTWEVSKAGEKYKKADRKREYLKLYLVHTPRTAEERQQNKNTLELAKRIRYERGQQLLESQEGYRIRIKNKNINFLEYYKAYISN